MSGDVQPRKRKDKKKRKDEGEQIPIQTHAPPPPTSPSSDDINIHVHKEGGTGGGICAKLVFFVLLSALVVVIGMIITQYRGLSDVATVDTESRFSQIFEGWIDSSPDHHEDHNIEEKLDHDVDHDEEENDEHDLDDDEEEEEEEEEENELSEEEEEEEGDDNNEDTEVSEEKHDEDEDEDEEEDVESSEENKLDDDDEEDEEEEDEDEVQASEEEKETYESEEKDEEEDDEDHEEDEQELENIASEEDKDEDEADDVSTEKVSGENDKDEDDEDDGEDEDADVEQKKRLKTRDAEDEKEETQQESSGGKSSISERQADVENSDSEKSEDEAAGYEYSNITNKDDYKIKSDIDEAQKSVQNNSAYAIKLFDKILQKHPSSPRSIYGKALALDYLADQRRSNDILEQALKFYTQLFNTKNVPNALFEVAAERCIKRMRFVGQYRNAINVHKLLIQKFPNNPKHQNDLAVTYLTINRVEAARSILKQILSTWPNNGFALVHFGFILKTSDNKLEEAIDYLQRGLDTRAEGVIDGRFYFHLGDSLARLGRNDEAMKVYEEGVKNNVFLSRYQRSLYNVPKLTGKPWWDLRDLPYLDLFRHLKQNWKKIRDEGLAVLNEKGYFQDESENLKDTGDWKQFELFARGHKNINNCRACPFTCSIIERIPEARSCKRGQTKFSVMHPGTHVWPHCGPTNCRLRAHLGLKVPPKTFIRVADETRSWKEGEVFVFDDSFEHEVWHNGTEFRLVLIVDIWHPELTAAEKRGLSPI